MIIDELITDRTEQDAKTAVALAALGWDRMTSAQKALWMNGMRGSYNATDLNRVGQAILYLESYLNGVQSELDAHRAIYHVAPDEQWTVDWDTLSLTVKTDWATVDRPTMSQMQEFLQNVDDVTACIEIQRNLPVTMSSLNVHGANEIEKALVAEYNATVAYVAEKEQLIENAASIWWYSGEIFGGEY